MLQLPAEIVGALLRTGAKFGFRRPVTFPPTLPPFRCCFATRTIVFSQLNAGGVYLKLGLVDPAFIRTQRLFGAQRLLINAFSVLEVY